MYVKSIIIVIALIIGSYYGIDHALSSHFRTETTQQSSQNQAMVQQMAQFLDSNDQIQRKIASVNPSLTSPGTSPSNSAFLKVSPGSTYLGSTPTDQFFKEVLNKRVSIDLQSPDATEVQMNQTIEMLDYVRANPKESLSVLEGALNSIPADLVQEREVLRSAYIHASINFIEELPEDVNAKMNYLKRLSESTNDPEVKSALQNHFSAMISGESVPMPRTETQEFQQGEISPTEPEQQ